MNRSRKEKSSSKIQQAGSHKGISQTGSVSKRAIKKLENANTATSCSKVQKTEEVAKQKAQTGLTQLRVDKDTRNPSENYRGKLAQHMEVHRNGVTLSRFTQSSKGSILTGNSSKVYQPISIIRGNVYSLYKHTLWEGPPWPSVPTEMEQKPQSLDDLNNTAEWDVLERAIYEWGIENCRTG